jgi:mRNA-degrading endonuclease RelE of RelBE toxin-antitoxin system
MRPTKRYEVRFTNRFKKSIKKLSAQNQTSVLATIATIEEYSPEYPSLETRKMTREDKWNKKQLFESRVNNDIRLIWYFDDEIIYILRVGHHDVEKMRKLQNY